MVKFGQSLAQQSGHDTMNTCTHEVSVLVVLELLEVIKLMYFYQMQTQSRQTRSKVKDILACTNTTPAAGSSQAPT